ncbi:radical SAM protein [Subsaximicrobium wynnwilliamsii]|uniref:Radical SAM protein n=1 Tax=Subsaximicrobium wynnwilliamsii TaxID=291179 RepID=A0A5C6ZKN8_9FLAO|nr:radical SAM protein [Subsaximicrobium wynnwilliamsii]TXD83516.1 radical SAM protein [Subsaximicrobium wynnwilliamsii]TXD89209.1 radical SAM protein [Subsaximicrobium wynnwilliamsii]TXE03196.1 radical SAM protein [Subsaximicrobium wynnwilliamsii]
MNQNFNHIQSVYWVFTQLCNDDCDHCYNDSSPFGKRISKDDCMAIIDNMPDKIDRIILSGGEPMADIKLLHAILDKIQARYKGETQIMLQTNGDLMKPKKLQVLIDKGVTRFDIASIDRYHKKAGGRLMELADIFESCGVNGTEKDPLLEGGHYLTENPLSWGYWGANEDMWLGGNWARGKALKHDNWLKDPDHNFCTILSGARNFLGGHEDIPQEISIQLWRINPCCPGTHFPMGDARKQKVADVLERASKSAVFKMLNDGDPLKMGESLGVTQEEASEKNQELKNICLYCDHFMKCHKDEIFDENGVKPSEQLV